MPVPQAVPEPDQTQLLNPNANSRELSMGDGGCVGLVKFLNIVTLVVRIIRIIHYNNIIIILVSLVPHRCGALYRSVLRNMNKDSTCIVQYTPAHGGTKGSGYCLNGAVTVLT